MRQGAAAGAPGGAPDSFVVDKLNGERQGGGLQARLLARLLNNPLWFFGILRVLCPVFRFPVIGWYVVTRYEHVRDVLAEDQVFLVPWRAKMKELNTNPPHGSAPPFQDSREADDPTVFVLGFDNADAHERARRELMSVFSLDDIDAIAAHSEHLARQIIEEHLARQGAENALIPFDAIRNLITHVPTLICRDYYGLPIKRDQEVAFAQWSIALSMYCFGDPADKPVLRETALHATTRISAILDEAIANARAGAQAAAPVTIVERLVAQGLSDQKIRGHLMGMVTGFVPTNTAASGHMLEALVGKGRLLSWRRRKFRRPTLEALCDEDHERFTRCLFETLRFWPINAGPFRRAASDFIVSGGGFLGRRDKIIPKDVKVLASLQSAMFDHRHVKNSYTFDPDRATSSFLHFGSGTHACLGIFMARAQIPATLKVLLAQPGLKRLTGKAGKLEYMGRFPAHLRVTFHRQEADDKEP